jgi:hypothetical protein
MNATQGLATRSTNCPAPFVSNLALVGPKLGQRLKNLRTFQVEYDTMLYMVEVMATLQTLNTTNPEQTKTIAKLKSLVIQERNGLGLSQAEKH